MLLFLLANVLGRGVWLLVFSSARAKSVERTSDFPLGFEVACL